MTAVASPSAHRIPIAAWPALAGLLLLIWAVRQGLGGVTSRSTLLTMLAGSLVMFVAALLLDRRASRVAAGRAKTATSEGAAVPSAQPAGTAMVVAAAPPAAPARTAGNAPPAADSLPPIMSMTLGDLLLGALIDAPDDAGRLLTAALSRANLTRQQAKPDLP